MAFRGIKPITYEPWSDELMLYEGSDLDRIRSSSWTRAGESDIQ
jgi:hypothetical protein